MNSDSDSEGSIDYKLHNIVVDEYNETNKRLSDRRRGVFNPHSSKRTVTPIDTSSYVNNNLPYHNDKKYTKKSWFLFICCCKRDND